MKHGIAAGWHGDEEDRGNGAKMDNSESQDNRRLMSGTCFSIEPGVYLKGKFGVRSEVNVYLAESETTVAGQPIQIYGTSIPSF
jgi:Xaa-Pro aminopeptidase